MGIYVQQQLEYGRFGALLEFATVRTAVESTYKIELQGRPQDTVYLLSITKDSLCMLSLCPAERNIWHLKSTLLSRQPCGPAQPCGVYLCCRTWTSW